MEEREKSPAWLSDLMDQVGEALQQLGQQRQDCSPALLHERAQLDTKIEGWNESLGNRGLDKGLRGAIEASWAAALQRQEEIDAELADTEFCKRQTEDIVQPAQVLERLDRLADVLANNNVPLGNLELSMHIDRIECFPDGKVRMRTCKLGTMPEVAELFRAPPESPQARSETSLGDVKLKPRPRRRTRLRVDPMENNQNNLRARLDFAADPERFAGLADEWFWVDNFQVPDAEPHWYMANAEAVFKRRQEEKLSHEKLAFEFGVSKPTIKAAIRCYLSQHPDAKDEVNLPRGRARSRTVNVESQADEVRRLWDAGTSDFALAKKFGWPTTAVERAIAISYAKDGLPVPTTAQRRQAKISRARFLLDEQLQQGEPPLEEIAQQLGVSDVTARKYLRESFTAEGKAMPDLRRRRDGDDQDDRLVG